LTPSPGLPADSLVHAVAEAVDRAGGRALVVGGGPRDWLLGRPTKDLDLEVFGLSRDRLAEVLEGFGCKGTVGRQLPVWRLPRADLDVSHPRAGALDYRPDRPDSLEAAFRRAARHRDLTINAIAWDPLDDRWIDPHHGRADLAARRLRAVDREKFASDPLRLLRVARFVACLEAEPDRELVETCRDMDFEGVPVERVAGELRRWLLGAERPSRGFHFLEDVGRLSLLGPVATLRGVPQDPRWHPEGDVFFHTLQVVDQAVRLARPLPPWEAEVLLWAALCHDLGKPATTRPEKGRIRAFRHDVVGARITADWLESLRLSGRLRRAVGALVRHHLAPVQLVSGGAGPKAYRRLARKLAEGGVTMLDLERLARADHLGRATEEATPDVFAEGEAFLAAARAAGVESGPRSDVVEASRLMARGLEEGPALGRALARCRVLEDERDQPDPDEIVDVVLKEGVGADRRSEPRRRQGSGFAVLSSARSLARALTRPSLGRSPVSATRRRDALAASARRADRDGPTRRARPPRASRRT